MNYPQQIKERVSISSIVSQKVSLKSKGKGEFLGLCPFHQEKTPSFTVSEQKGFYHCFGCSAHGDIFSFLMETEGDSYKDVLKKLASMAGITLPEDSSKLLKWKNQNEILLKIFGQASDFYKNQLKTKVGKRALEYLYSRGLSKEAIDKYELGFSPENSSAIVELLNSKFSKEDLRRANIFHSKGSREYDPLSGRIIFPIHNKSGGVIAFGGRVLGDGQPKYLNSSESPIFEKGKVLYGMHLAKKTIYKEGDAIVTEGYMDVISLANFGIDNAVAPLGTSLKISQLELLWQITPNPVICMDSDIAGSNAESRIARNVLEHINSQKTLKFAKLTGGKDPDEVLTKHGSLSFKKSIKDAIPLAQKLFEIETKEGSFDTPEKKVRLQEELENLVNKIQNPLLKNEYRKYFKNLFYNTFSRGKQKVKGIKEIKRAKNSSKYASHETEIFHILLNKPSLLRKEKILEELIRVEFNSIILDKLRNYILSNIDNLESNDVKKKLQASDIEKEVGNLIEELRSFGASPRVYESEDAEKRLVRAFKLNSLSVLKAQIKGAESLVKENANPSFFERLMILKSLENQLKLELNII